MFQIACTYRPSDGGYTFHPEDAESDYQCDLRVTIRPLAYYPAEPDVGAGADFDFEFEAIEVADHQGGQSWRTLEGAESKAAEAFLDAHHQEALFEQAETEVAEAFGAPRYRRAA